MAKSLKLRRIACALLCAGMVISSCACSSETTTSSANSSLAESTTGTSDPASTEESTDETTSEAESKDENSSAESNEENSSAESKEENSSEESKEETGSATAQTTTKTDKTEADNKPGTTTTSTAKPKPATSITTAKPDATTTTTAKPTTTTTAKPTTTTTAKPTTTTTAKPTTTTSKPAPQPSGSNVEIKLEAENASLSGGAYVISGSNFSGGKAVEKLANDWEKIELTVDIPADGMYDIIVHAYGHASDKTNTITIDGKSVGDFISKANTLSDGEVKGINIKKGSHTIGFKKSWGYITIDYITIRSAKQVDNSIYNVSTTLVNKNATANTKSLYRFLCNNFGKYIISGQQADRGLSSSEFEVIKRQTGKLPALLGLDMMDYTPSRQDFGASSRAVDYAIDFYNEGGIVTFCWHWNAPKEYLYSTANNQDGWWGGFYTDRSNFDIAKVMNGQDTAGKAAIDRDIKAIAQQLKKLEQAGVPVLWRPLHEASGGWFWWGAKGADAYKKLWIYLYDQLTNVYQCNNLIWVYNGQNPAWYPGDQYVDIIGEDIYAGEKVYSPQTAKFEEARSSTNKNKIIALTENGCLVDPDNAAATNTRWAWFMTWSGSYVTGEQYNEFSMLKKVYQSEHVLTLDELPDVYNY